VGNKRPTRCNSLVFITKIYCPLNMFRAALCPSSGAQELYRWLLPVVHGALVYRSLVWRGAVGFVSWLRDIVQHVERTISFAIKTNLLPLVGLLFSTHYRRRTVKLTSSLNDDFHRNFK